MNKEKQIVPELRFPEFIDEWEVNILGNKKISFFPNIKTPKGELEIDTYVSTENLLPDYGGVKKSNKLPDSGSFTTYQAGDILVANIRPYLKKVWFADRKGAASNDVFVFRKGSAISENYLQHILKNDLFINYVMKGAKGVKMPRGDKSLIKKYAVYFPSNPKEQQKIANFLSSLDEVITAETEKLEVLQDHKKGLLQQLFPAEGETKPQYRFPEFKNDGDWEETTLDDVAEYENGKAHEKEISASGKYKVVNSKFISTDGKTVKYSDSANLKANIGDILMVLSDIPNGKAIAKCFYVYEDDTFTVNQRICKITPTDIDNKFLFYIQNRNKYFLAFDDGAKQTNLRKDTVLSFPFLKPKNIKEQQKIANCLTSADGLITAQEQKIEKLKAHKKGLMQQLFPNVNSAVL